MQITRRREIRNPTSRLGREARRQRSIVRAAALRRPTSILRRLTRILGGNPIRSTMRGTATAPERALMCDPPRLPRCRCCSCVLSSNCRRPARCGVRHAMSSEPVKGPASYFPSIEKKYGRPIDEWQQLVRERLPAKQMELVAMLKADHGMGHGHANAIVAHVLAGGKT